MYVHSEVKLLLIDIEAMYAMILISSAVVF